ncbi:glutamate--cysteine ligase [Streptomyces sp. NPDC006733]|uniref:carboxylate-amine ligase n=1 Tax=Streptomyces sp. NPDC006733 TaxID=3155460 RepID=UPI0033C32F5A
MITIGVEEEYLLLDPASALPVSRSEQVRSAAGLGPIVETGEIQAELLQAQVEVATPVCSELSEVSAHLIRLRRALAVAAERAQCRVAASGTAPLKDAVPVPVTPRPRYLALREQAQQLVHEQLVNGMHVHVAVPDREIGVAVLNRIRPWLPVLIAMGANSPVWEWNDTGFASWRTVLFGRWPVSGPTPQFADLADYERRMQALLSAGVIADTGQLYWHARLSERYPTVEVRCLDVQLRTDEAVMFAGMVRALVATAMRDERAGTPIPQCPQELLHAMTWHAARHGLGSALVDAQGRQRRAGDVVCALVDHLSPALEEAGDTREVTSLLHRFLQEGTGADRQRRALVSGGMHSLIDLVTDRAGEA